MILQPHSSGFFHFRHSSCCSWNHIGKLFCMTCHGHSSRTVPSCLPLKKSLIPIQWITDREGSLNWGFLSIITSEFHFMIEFEFLPFAQWPGTVFFWENITRTGYYLQSIREEAAGSCFPSVAMQHLSLVRNLAARFCLSTKRRMGKEGWRVASRYTALGS